MSPNRWKVFWNTSAQVIGRIVGAGTTLIVSVLIARTFGAQGYGDFAKITTYVALFYLLADFGMNAIFLQKPQAVWGELLGVRVVGGVMLIFLALAILAFLPQGMGQGYTSLVRLGIIVFLPSIVLQAIITTTNAEFQRTLRYDRSSMAIVVGSVVTVASVWLFIRVGVIGAIGGIVIGAGVTATTALFFVKRLGNPLRFAITRSSLLSYITQSLPLGATLVFNLVYFRTDHLILTLTRSTAEVGIYGLAYKVFEFPIAIPTFFMNAVYPLMVHGIRDSQKGIIKHSFFVLLIISFVTLIAFWFAAPLLVHIRPEFGGSVGVLRVLSLSLPFFFLTSLTMWTLIALKRQAVLVMIYGTSMIVNILLNMWLVPIYGVMAAAWVTVSTEAMVLLISAMALWRRI